MNASLDSQQESPTADETSGLHSCGCDDGEHGASRLAGSDGSRNLPGTIFRWPALAAIGAVRLYQLMISPWLGKRCRFYPSCSQYYILAVQKYGLIRGSVKGTARICRCHPWNPGGYDPP